MFEIIITRSSRVQQRAEMREDDGDTKSWGEDSVLECYKRDRNQKDTKRASLEAPTHGLSASPILDIHLDTRHIPFSHLAQSQPPQVQIHK